MIRSPFKVFTSLVKAVYFINQSLTQDATWVKEVASK
jgi:hypothetical protein